MISPRVFSCVSQMFVQRLMLSLGLFTLCFFLGGILLSVSLKAQSLTWLGTLGGDGSWAHGVSAEGSVVVGFAKNASGNWRAFRWTSATGMQDLGALGGDLSSAYGVSADGNVVVGWANNESGQGRAFRWTSATGMEDLGSLGGDESLAYGVSADGSVVVGEAKNAFGWVRAFRWTATTGMENLGTLIGGGNSWANDVSSDGSVVVGTAENAFGWVRAFRWTATTGMKDLGTLTGEGWSYANSVSADGSVVVGWANHASGQDHAFRWTAATGMQDLGTIGGESSRALGVSADGSVVVGWAGNESGQGRAFRWTAATGMQDLNEVFINLLQDGSELLSATDISLEGRFIVGLGYNARTGRTEAFLLDTEQASSAGEEPISSFLLSIFPQPVVGNGTVRFRLTEPSTVVLELVDLTGRKIVLAEGWYADGVHYVELPVLSAGIYFCRFRAGTVVEVEPILCGKIW
ncbi:MAG: hypothetical protein CH6_0839 [Candidatus Kapaibacterium sp.]|nr:MAG: hypothetical protein CH6_0839 [Candidatus Kapabacteria bacterium]